MAAELSSQHLFSVQGHVAVVTGAGSGIGYMISRVSFYSLSSRFACLPFGRQGLLFLRLGTPILRCRAQGLVANGAKVYLADRNPVETQVEALNELGRETGGTAFGYVYHEFKRSMGANS